MKKRPFSLPPIVENLIIGTLTGVLVGYIVKFLLNRYEEATLVMIVLVLIGVVLGVLSGFERKRMLKLRLEKLSLEEDLVKSQASLRKSANKYRLLIENASDAIFLTTKNGRFLLFNEATCLLSGYSKNQLKEVKLSQLQAVDGDDKQDKMSQAWLDNSICRYEEDWRTKSGQIVTLEISAKWFQLGGNELTLHVGRDIMHRKEVSDDSKIKEVRTLQYAKLIELAMTQNNFYQEIVDPVNDTIRIFNHLSKNHPEMKDKLLGSISKWEKARGFLQGMLAKNIRDLESSPTQYDINDILNQEIQYLKRIMDIDGLIVHTNFNPNLPPVWGLGKDFSVALGLVLKTIMSIVKLGKKLEFTVSTEIMGTDVLVMINAPPSDDFKECFAKIISPLLEKADSVSKDQIEIAWSVGQRFFQAIGATFESDFFNNKKDHQLVVTIRIPTVQKNQKVIRIQKPKKSSNQSTIL